MNSRFLAPNTSRQTKMFFLLSLFLFVPFLAEAQCPPEITITPQTGNTVISGNNVSFCPGDSCLLTASPASGVTYQWYRDNTLIIGETTNVYYPHESGEYHVRISGCPDPSINVNISLFPLPNGQINNLTGSPVCSGTDVTFELVGSPNLGSYDHGWLAPFDGSPNPFILEANATTTVRAFLANDKGCSRIVSNTVFVHQPISPGTINANQAICSGTSPLELSGSSASGGDGIFTYQWQSSINAGVSWSDIPGATSLNYQPGILTQTTLFRRVVYSNSPCPAVTQYTPVTITVNEIPSITSPAAVSICSNSALSYTPTSNVPGTTFTWTGSNTSGTVNGVSPSGTSAINDFLSIASGSTVSGTATYTIIPTGPAPTFCEGDPIYLVVTVNPLPSPTINGPTPVCLGSSGNLYATDPGMSNYVWTISPGGTINSGQGTYEISVTWTTTGPRWVRVIYTGGNTCAPLTPTQYNVTVNPLPDPIITGPNAPCLGASGNVYSTAAGMTNYIWNVSPGGTITGSGSPTDNTAIVTWNSTGVQWISLTYTDINGCTNTTPKQYLVNVSAPSLSGPQSPCLGSTGNVYTAGSGNTDYVWTVSPGGTITSGGGATNNTATITWNATGPQTVSVNYKTAAGCTAALPATLNVDVKPLPTPTINGNTNVCAGTTGVVYTTESGKSLYTWTVSAGGTITSGGTPGSNTATVTWNTAGPQQISVNYTDSNGCSAESPTVYPVSVNTQPTPTILGSNSECVGTTGVVYSTEIGMSNYVWTISGGTITSGAGTNSVVVTWTAVGSRWVAVNYTGASGCNATAPTQYPVTVLPLPLPTVTGPNAVCVDATNVEYSTETGMSGYQWTVPTGGTIVGSSTNNTVFVTWNTVGSHTLSVTYTGTNGCAAATPTNYNVSVNPLPTPSITGPADVCRNSTANVYTTQPGMTNYVWSISGGTITAGGNGNNTATVTWNTTGNQSISVNYEQTGCPATSPTVYPVFVNPLPIVDAGPAQSIQNGTSTVLNGTASGGTGLLSYQWTPVNLIASGATSLMPTTENIYVTQIFDLEVTDSKLCASSDQVVITALGDPLSVAASATPDIICNNGATVQLGATANGGNSSFQADYSWTSTPAGFTSNAQNPIANPTVTTTYNVSVWDGFNTATNTILVTVNPLPTVYSVTGGGEYCAGGSGVSVGLNGSQTGVSYQLLLNGSDIGAPISGTGGAISFTNNTAAGVYTIRAINGTTTCERNMAGSVTISINPLPTSFAGNSELIPYGTNTTLTGVAGAGTPPYNYLWTPAVNINGSNTSHTATTTNLFTNTDFTFRVTDSKNCVANDIVSITLDGSALAVTATAVEDIICNNGETVQLNASATGGNSATQVNYSWTSTPAGFTSTAQSPQVNPTQTTIYYISVNDGFNTATNSVTVTVNPLPTPFTVTGGGEYCNGGGGLAVGLNGSQLGVNYQLLRNGSNIGASVAGTGAAISFGNHTNAGLYTVHATNSTTTCERTMTGSTSIAVNPLPVASAGVDKSINHGTSTTLNGSASSGTSPWTYSWTPINRINSGANTSTPVTENLFTTTAFDLTVTDAKGCTDTDQMQVIVLGNPLSVNASVNNSTICSGATAQLSATGSGGNLIYTYSWSSNPAGWTSTEQNPVINPTVTTDYTVTINDGYNTATSSVNVFVNPLATVYNVTGGGSYCSGDAGVAVGLSNSEIGVNYQLYRNGTSVGSAVSGTGSPISFGLQTGAGSYTVKATTAITGCENDMAATVDVNTLPLPNVYTMTGGGSYPQGGIGVIVGITNSQIGVNYQLLLNGNDIGAAVAGTGSPLDFGYQTGAGVYTAIGIDAVTGCDIEMSSTATVIINPYPSIFHVYGGGSICAGSSVEVGLDGSEIGVAYTLSRNGTSVLVGIPGTGDSLHFGSFSTQGIYTVRAQNISTGLTRNMDGNAEIIVNPLPIPYSLSYFQPGDNCAPIIPRLGGSEIGAVYELNYEDFNGFYTAAIETINGTGNPFNFSSQTNPGIYTVSAYIDYTNVICRIDMIGSLVADSLPKEFQITPQGQLCENDQELCLAGSEAGINYRLWLNGQPVGAIVPGDINGGPICFGTLNAPGTYRINAINTITGCEIFYTNQVVVNPQPIKYVMSPVADCAGSEIILEDCELGIDYYLYHEPATKEFIEVQGPLTCTGSGPIDFGPQVDEGVYRIKAVNPATNCWAWMDGSTTIYPNPEIFDISPQSGGCAPIAIYLEDFEADATYYLYRGATLVSSIAGSSGSVNFGLQNVAGTYTVTAKITHPGGLECWSDMSGEVIIYNSATVFTLTPQGPSCPDPAVTFRLSGSEPAVNYTLWHDASGVKETIVGTGLAFNFSPQSEPGQYWVIASTGNACQTQMNGMGVIHEIPALYTITPSGQFCSNDDLEIGLSNSELGVTYRLYRANTAITPPVIVAGTGNAISFGTNNWVAGTYTVMAVDDVTGCDRLMDGTLVISNPPNIYAVLANGVIATSGLYCAPSTIGLALSQLGVDYTLHSPDGNNTTLAGTGFPLDFGPFSYPGEYSITAFNSATSCSSLMSGTVNIYDDPEVFVLVSLTDPLYCFGDNSAIELVLNYSQIGASYQLYRDTDANPVFAAQPGTGGSLSWTAVSQYGPGDYYVKSSFIADPTCSAVMDGVIPVEEIDLPTAALSGTQTICSTYCTDLVFNITAAKAFTLTYSANNQLQAPVSFNPGDDFRVQVCPTVNTEYEIQSIEYTEFPYCIGTDISGTFDVIVEPLPAITVNNPGTTCIATPYLTSVVTENTVSYEWIIINGNGSISVPNNTENITYTPAAGDEGTTVVLQLTAFGVNTCSAESVSELVEINVEPIPQIDMGSNGLICETGTFTTNTTIDFGSAYLWEIVSGNGTINPIDQPNTRYTAAAGDGGNLVQLRLSVTGEGTCVNETVSDVLDIIIEPLPTADAGAGGVICESETFQLNGSATNHTTVLWEVIDGSGTFDNPSVLNAIFTPADISNNTSMRLRLTAAGTGTCNSEIATSEVIINVDPLPEAYAGLGGVICETQGYHFATASVRNNSSFVWEIQDGAGHFDDPLHLSPVFYPDPVSQITDMTLRLVAYGINNCSNATDTSFVTITVHPQPVAYAGAGGETCVNMPFALTDASAQHQRSVLWEVVSGAGHIDSPLNVNPNYIPNAADAETVVTLKLTAYGAGPCSAISTNDFVNIFIQGLPTVDAGPNLQTCFLDPVTITQASASNYEQILWTHDGNGTLNNSNTISPTYIPAAGDEGNTITLTLSAEGMSSCAGELATDQTTILVAPLPTAFAGLDATICELENYTILDASATFESSVVWSVINGSGSITQPFLVNTTYIPAASDAGTTVRLRLTVYGRGNCAAYSSFDEINISVVESPIALFSVDTPVCENEVVSFTDQSSTTAGIIEQWVWDFGDGSAPITINFPDNPNATHTYTISGAYTVSLLATTTNGCTDLYSTEINISPAPVAAFDYNGGLCAESEVNFIDLSQVNGGGNIMSWNWNFGDGAFSTEQNPSHIFNAAGDYVVSLTVTNMANCVSQPFVQTITIGDPITVTIDDTDLIACLNESHQFNGISPEAVYWNWDFGDGTSSTLQNPTHTYTSIGNYTVTLTGSDINGCQNVDVVTLTVRPNPIAFFTADQSACVNGEIDFIDASISPNGQIVEWLWEMGDGTVIGPITNPADRNVVHQYAFAGSYEVELTVTDVNGCTDVYARILVIENGPLANFTFEAACEGQAVIFTDLSTPNGGS
ncbi:MAG: PKD domain-containing protein, partial [Bacteroidales bacterium]|nr:PKD domain-containing protein [Bacteroidales bacterium]